MKKIPMGIENFKRMIDNDYYFVDKTMLIKELIDETVVLYTRPRRFGKTLNMSMLYYFFSNKEKENAYLFDGLAISQEKEILKHQNSYSVIFLTLKDMKRGNFQDQVLKFGSLISNAISQYEEILDSPYLNEQMDTNGLQDASISYYDGKEEFYHGFLTGMLQGYPVKSNRESGNGRFDIVIIPKDFDDRGIIIECKKAGSLRELKKKRRSSNTNKGKRIYRRI